MKKLTILLAIFLGAVTYGKAQEEVEPIETEEIEVNDDTTKIKLGNITIIINEDESSDDFDFDDSEFEDKEEESNDIESVLEIDFGVNGWLNSANEWSFNSPYQEMNVDIPSSRMFSARLMMKGLDIANKHLYFSPGIGITWNGYKFEENVTIGTAGDTTVFAVDSVITYDKYKFRNTYLNVPLLVGVRLGNPDDNHFTLQFGANFGLNVGNIVKIKYMSDNTKYKDKIKDDFNVSPFRIQPEVRVKYNGFGLFARYSINPLFDKGKTQEIYPFSLGITLGGL